MNTDNHEGWWSEEAMGLAAEHYRKCAAEIFHELGGVRPITFLMATFDVEKNAPLDGPTVVMIPVEEEFNEAGKQAYTGRVRQVAKLTKAVGLIHITETWLLRGASLEEGKRWKGRLDQHPERGEMLMQTVEHARTPQEIWTAEITRPDGLPPVLAEWIKAPTAKATGRFMGMLPRYD